MFGTELQYDYIAEDGRWSSEVQRHHIVSVPIARQLQSLESALQGFVTVDSLAGGLQRTRCCTSFKSLPDQLIFHLKRTTFDFETMTTVKCNNRLSFPLVLNMRDFTVEGRTGMRDCPPSEPCLRPDAYYCYCLKGVVLHEGTASMGQFTSLVRDGKRADGSDLWVLCNDALVKEVDVQQVLSRCFGGEPNGENRSAYILLYERSSIGDGVVSMSPVPAADEAGLSSDPSSIPAALVQKLLRARRTESSCGRVLVPVPSHLAEVVPLRIRVHRCFVSCMSVCSL